MNRSWRDRECTCPRVDPVQIPFGFPLSNGMTERHRSDCPRVAWIEETRQRLLPELIEADRVRRRGAAEAMNAWIG